MNTGLVGVENKKAKRTSVLLGVSVLVTAVLWTVPEANVVAYPLLLVSTFVHEMGHGLASFLVGGHLESLHINADGSGVAYTVTDGDRIDRALVAAGGLVGPAVCAAIGFWIGRRGTWSRTALKILGVFLVIVTLLWVRTWTGVAVAVGLVAASVIFGVVVKGTYAAQLWVLFMSTQMALSVFSRGDYLFTATAGPNPSDSAAMASALAGPYWFWGGVCGLFSVVVLIAGMGNLIWATYRTITEDQSY